VAARHRDRSRSYAAQYRGLAGFIVASAAFVAIFVAVTVSAFHQPAPHDLPFGIVGSAAVTSQVEHTVDRAAPGAFSWRSYSSQATARTGIAQREVDGALVTSGADLRLLVTQAGGTASAQFFTQAFGTVAARSGRLLTVSDVVPPLASDSQALSSWFMCLGVLIPSLAAGSASAMAFRRARPALSVVALVAVAAVIGVVAAAIADAIAGLGNYAAIAGIVALFALGVASVTAALARIWPPLTALAVLAFIVFGIPISGGPANLASFGPGFVRFLNPALPLGVAANAVRNVVYFGGNDTIPRVWTLAAWALAGVAGLILLGMLRRPSRVLDEPAVPPLGLAEPAPGMADHAPTLGGPVPDTSRDVPPIRLVIGFDNSEPARRALNWGADLLKERPGTLHVVYSDRVRIDSDLTGFAYAEMEDTRNQKAAEVAEAAAKIARAAGVPYTFERREESPADAILSAASAQAAAEPASTPLIVTGRSHHVPHRVIGSVPVRLLHESPYPVLAIA
jgi:nucleotide-binding universal stress UspA family protein